MVKGLLFNQQSAQDPSACTVLAVEVGDQVNSLLARYRQPQLAATRFPGGDRYGASHQVAYCYLRAAGLFAEQGVRAIGAGPDTQRDLLRSAAESKHEIANRIADGGAARRSVTSQRKQPGNGSARLLPVAPLTGTPPLYHWYERKEPLTLA